MSSEKVVCPFCPLHCDDLQIDADGNVDVNCEIARDAFPVAVAETSCRIGRETVTVDEANRHARHLFGQSVPTVVTRSVTLAAAKRLEHLQSQGRIQWRMDQPSAATAFRRSISRDGVIAATLADVRRHADRVWVIGNRDEQRLPRLKELLSTSSGDANPLHSSGGVRSAELANLLNGVRHQRRPEEDAVAVAYDFVTHAKYLAVIWVDDGFDAVESCAASSLLLELVALLNQPDGDVSRRAALVTFDASVTAQSVSLWRRNAALDDRWMDDLAPNGQALSGDGPDNNRGANVIRFGSPADGSGHVAIQVGGRDGGIGCSDVYVPAAVEGVHRSDMVIRGDGAVTLPLAELVSSRSLTPSEWLSQFFGQELG